MSNYTLNIAFTNQQIETLFATGTNVVLSKPPKGDQPNVAWQVFKPAPSNVVSWVEEYGIYASSTLITQGAYIPQYSNTSIPAYTGKLYTLEPSGVISGPASGGFLEAFTLKNQYDSKDYMAAGIYQNATVNNSTIKGNATSSNYVLLTNSLKMKPTTTTYIWLQSQVKSNTIVTNVTSPMTELIFPAGVNELSIAYDSSSGTFIPTGMAMKHIPLFNVIQATL